MSIDRSILLDESIHIWGSYDPNIIRYSRFYKKDPSILASGRKIVDTYHAFVNGRAALYYSYEDNYGDLAANDETSKLFIRSLFVRNALISYGISLDISWQAVWAYIYPSSFDDIINDNFETYSKYCDRDNLLKQLDCCISQGSVKAECLKKIVKEFDNDKITLELRALYNYLKHRGDIHVEGLGDNDIYQGVVVNDTNLPALARKSYKLDELQELGLQYTAAFQDYFQKIVNEIVSEEYKNNTGDFLDVIKAQINMKAMMDERITDK